MNTLKPPSVISTAANIDVCQCVEASLRNRCEQHARHGTLTDVLCALAAYDALTTLGIIPATHAHDVRKQCLGMFHNRPQNRLNSEV